MTESAGKLIVIKRLFRVVPEESLEPEQYAKASSILRPRVVPVYRLVFKSEHRPQSIPAATWRNTVLKSRNFKVA